MLRMDIFVPLWISEEVIHRELEEVHQREGKVDSHQQTSVTPNAQQHSPLLDLLTRVSCRSVPGKSKR